MIFSGSLGEAFLEFSAGVWQTYVRLVNSSMVDIIEADHANGMV